MVNSMTLYNKYRPKIFKEVVGQEGIIKALQYQIKTKKLGHTYIFVGPKGTGKTTTARIFARAINCTSEESKPCGFCPHCKSILEGKSLSIQEIDAASNRGIEAAKKIEDTATYRPVDMHYKVYIIDEFHMLTKEAFNSLLKLLEEPPEYCIFILCTTELNKVPLTIRSRGQMLLFKNLDIETIATQLAHICSQEALKYELEALYLIAKLAKGGMRDALSLLETCAYTTISLENVRKLIGYSGEEELFLLLNSIADKDQLQLLNTLSIIEKRGMEVIDLINLLQEINGDLLKASLGAIETIYNTPNYKQELIALSKKWNTEQICEFISVLSELKTQIKGDFYGYTSLEVVLVTFVFQENRIATLEKKIQTLEEEIKQLKFSKVVAKEMKESSEAAESKEEESEITLKEFANSMGWKGSSPFSWDDEEWRF